MFTYKETNYNDFKEFANAMSETAFAGMNVNSDEATVITAPVDDWKGDMLTSGVFRVANVVFAISECFEGIETTATGEQNKRKRRLVKFADGTIKRADDITQLKRMIGAATGQNPSGIKCGKSRKVSVNNITLDNAETVQAQAIAQVQAIENVLTFAGLNVEDIINNITANITAKVETLKAEQQKAENLKKLQGLSPEQIAKMMALLEE